MPHHHHHGATASRKLLIASIATASFVIIEIVVGIRANSLALIGDALHNVTDTLALLLALFAVRVERRPATTAKSYGWHRAGVLAAFINAGALAAFTIFLFIEAAQRLRAPASLNSSAMLITAGAALVLNGAITLWLRVEGRHDLNIRGAVLHMLGDAISSAGIIIAALLIRRTGALFWDPAVSIAIGVLILWSSWGILREAINLLLEGTPDGIDPEAVTRAIAALDGMHPRRSDGGAEGNSTDCGIAVSGTFQATIRSPALIGIVSFPFRSSARRWSSMPPQVPAIVGSRRTQWMGSPC